MEHLDVRVTNCGSIFTFDLLTDTATDWSREHVPDDAPFHVGPTRAGATLYVEHRFARDLADGMLADGLRLE